MLGTGHESIRARILIRACFALCLAALAAAASLRDAVAAPTVTQFTLANGLAVVVIPDRRTPVVTHMLWYRVGAADEPAGKSGIAHFLEHLMFKGTAKNPAGRFSQRLAAIGGQENAFTSNDYTGYFQRVAREHLAELMEFEADRMTGLVLTDDIIAAERNVILEERNQRIENEPGARLSEQVTAAQYLNHPYHRPIIGWRHEMETLDRDGCARVLPALLRAGQCRAGGGGRRDARGGEDAGARRPTARSSVTARSARASGRRSRRRSPSGASPSRTCASPSRASSAAIWCRPTPPRRAARTMRSTCWRTSSAAARTAGSTARWCTEQRVATNAGAWYQGTSLDATRFGLYATPATGVALDKLESAIDAVIADVRSTRDRAPRSSSAPRAA